MTTAQLAIDQIHVRPGAGGAIEVLGSVCWLIDQPTTESYSPGDAVGAEGQDPYALAENSIVGEFFHKFNVDSASGPFEKMRIVQVAGRKPCHLLDRPGTFVMYLGSEGKNTKIVQRTIYLTSVPSDLRKNVKLWLSDPKIRSRQFDEVTVPRGFVVECFRSHSSLRFLHPRQLEEGIYLLWRGKNEWEIQPPRLKHATPTQAHGASVLTWLRGLTILVLGWMWGRSWKD